MVTDYVGQTVVVLIEYAGLRMVMVTDYDVQSESYNDKVC